jgi:hypothetical protein
MCPCDPCASNCPCGSCGPQQMGRDVNCPQLSPRTNQVRSKAQTSHAPHPSFCFAHAPRMLWCSSLQDLQASAMCHTLRYHIMLCPVSTRGVQQATQQAQQPRQAQFSSREQPTAVGVCVQVGRVPVPLKPPLPKGHLLPTTPPTPSRQKSLGSKQASENHVPMPQNVRYRLAADQLVDPRRYTAAATAGRKLQLPSYNTQSALDKFQR